MGMHTLMYAQLPPIEQLLVVIIIIMIVELAKAFIINTSS
jgi:hypothetical protein